MAKNENQVSTIIAKVNGRNKVLDFRDGLVVANINDYAMLHGCGGEGHAPSSVIKVYLCDYSAGTGSKSRTVSASISPVLCEQILEVCKHNVGTQVIPDDFAFFTEQRLSNKKMARMADMCHCALQGTQMLFERYAGKAKENDAPSTAAVLEALSAYFKKALERAAAEPASPAREVAMSLTRHLDFHYSQDRVHNYHSKTGGGNIAPVQKLEIRHTAYRKEGDLANYPWSKGKRSEKLISLSARVSNSRKRTRPAPRDRTGTSYRNRPHDIDGAGTISKKGSGLIGLSEASKIFSPSYRLAVNSLRAKKALALTEAKRRPSPVRYEVVKLLAANERTSCGDITYFTGASVQTLRGMERAELLAFSEAEELRTLISALAGTR